MCRQLYGILDNMQENDKQKQQPEIIYEDSDLLVINKPDGLVVHSDGRTDEHTLTDWLVDHYPEIKEVGEPWNFQTKAGGTITIPRPGIVHRLDRETSGVLIIAKKQDSYEYLKEQFKNRKIQKEYRAILNGVFKEAFMEGIIDKKIGKSPSDFRKWSAQPGARGTMREAVTHYIVINQVGIGNEGYSYVSAKPKTGRTHQLRVHFKAIHHPILGDRLYGVKKVKNIGVKVPRTMLHAYKIKFENQKGEEMEFTAQIPNDFLDILEKVKLL